jgi:NADPH:quinone reductase-like Zn-dependent oxidoreductase
VTVDAVGPGAQAIPLGTRVAVDPALGYEWYDGQGQGDVVRGVAHADRRRAHAGRLRRVRGGAGREPAGDPRGLRVDDAAAAGLVFVTAWRALISRGGLRPGERVLITGASGGVGTAAVQIAVRAGARVYAVAGGPEKVRLVQELGAHVVYDRHQVDFSREVWRDTQKKGVHLVLDTVGESVWPSCLRALAPCGRLVTSGATTGSRGVTEIRLVFWKQLSILGSTMGSPAEYRQVMRLVFDKAVVPVIHEVIPLDETRRAHELLEAGKVLGKLVIVP